MNVLVLLSRVPYPLEKGDKLRAFHHLKLLAETRSVIVVALADGPLHPEAKERLKAHCSELHIVRLSWTTRLLNLALGFLRGIPLSTGYFTSRKARHVVADVIKRTSPGHIYCQLTRMGEYARYVKEVPRTLDFQDAFSKGMERRSRREPWPIRWFFRMEQRRLARYESRMVEEFDHCIIISAQDRDCIPHDDRHDISVVPNGVDLERFSPRSATKDYELVFAGNMAYPPNIESVAFLVEQVLPLVWRARPNVRLLVAGATPSRRIQSLASANVHVSGWVDEISESYARAKIFVAPMLISIGLQNKLLEAMAMRLPCITSKLANNALGGTHGENVLICSSADEYAAAIIMLLDDPDSAARLAAAGRAFVSEQYSWRTMTEPLLNIIDGAAAGVNS